MLASVNGLAAGLRDLAAGNLAVTIETRFPSAYDQLRVDFNRALAQLSEVTRAIDGSTRAMATGVQFAAQSAQRVDTIVVAQRKASCGHGKTRLGYRGGDLAAIGV